MKTLEEVIGQVQFDKFSSSPYKYDEKRLEKQAYKMFARTSKFLQSNAEFEDQENFPRINFIINLRILCNVIFYIDINSWSLKSYPLPFWYLYKYSFPKEGVTYNRVPVNYEIFDSIIDINHKRFFQTHQH
jgi:hypothetical protein